MQVELFDHTHLQIDDATLPPLTLGPWGYDPSSRSSSPRLCPGRCGNCATAILALR